MNREILFRGKRIDNDEWVYGFLRCRNYIDVWTPHTWEEEDGSTGEYATVESYQVKPETVGQFTGLTDKNDKKIFEGDIARQTYEVCTQSLDLVGYHIGEVKISKHNGAIIYRPYSYDSLYGENHKTKRLVNIAQYRSEVIGNIYDNPELLEVEND
nr:MAG TPA: YopX protein [Caudoviricetes sp.]